MPTDASGFEGTREVAAQHAVDTAALGAWLSRHLSGFEGPLSVAMFMGGQSNPTYKLTTPARSYVMRAKPGLAAKLLPSAHAIEREYAVMRALAGSEVPVPAMLCLCEDESIIGRAFYVMDFVDGRVLWDPALPGMSREERGRIYDEMNRVVAALHSVDWRALGLEHYGRPGNYFERQIARWSRQYQASVTEPIAEMDRLIEWLPAHMPPGARDPAKVCIVHGDYRLDNLIFHLEALGIPGEQDYIRRWCERTSLADPKTLAGEWNFYLAYNLFRLAAILQGIAGRARDGTASSAQAEDAGAKARGLAELAWQFAQRSASSPSP